MGEPQKKDPLDIRNHPGLRRVQPKRGNDDDPQASADAMKAQHAADAAAAEKTTPPAAPAQSQEPAMSEPKMRIEEEATPPAEAELDADEREFRNMRRDVDGVKGASGAGIVAISVGKTPEKNAFFRTSRDFQMITAILDHAVGMENKFFAVTPDMVVELQSIGITAVADHSLYLCCRFGERRLSPHSAVRQADGISAS